MEFQVTEFLKMVILLSIDVGVDKNGFFGDAAITIAIGDIR